MIVQIDPVIFSLGPVQVRWYGLMYVIGFMISGYLARKLVDRGFFKVTKEKVDSLITTMLIGMILGARIIYVIVYNWDYYSNHLLESFAVWQGGLSFHGALLGLLAGGFVFAKRNKISWAQVMDVTALVGTPGLFFGRIGNFINGELVGRVTDVSWCFNFNGYDGCRHPSQLYESAKNLLIFGTLWNLKNKNYKLKLVTQQAPVVLSDIIHVLDASELSSIGNKSQVDRHDVAECVLETLKPTAFDGVNQISETGRFVIVDNYEIAGGGIILAPVFEEETTLKKRIKSRAFNWERSDITPGKRAEKYKHKSALVVMAGELNTGKINIAKALEETLFKMGKFTYFLGISNELLVAGMGLNDKVLEKARHIQHLGEISYILADAGLILITSISNVDRYELDMLKALNSSHKTVIVNVGENTFPEGYVDLVLQENEDPQTAAQKITDVLLKAILPDPEYTI